MLITFPNHSQFVKGLWIPWMLEGITSYNHSCHNKTLNRFTLLQKKPQNKPKTTTTTQQKHNQLRIAFYYIWLNAGINSPKFISSLPENLICLIVIIKQHHMQMSPVFLKLNLFSISSDSVLVFLGGGEACGWLLVERCVCVRWHLRVVRKSANSSTRDTQNSLPWSDHVNLKEIKSKAWRKYDLGGWEVPGEECTVQRAVPWAGAAHQSWRGLDHIVSHLGDAAMQIRENLENMMRLWEEMTPLYPASDNTESPALLFAPQLTEGWALQSTVKPCRHCFGENKWHQLHLRETETEQLCPWQGPGEVGTGWSLRSLSAQTILWLCGCTNSLTLLWLPRVTGLYRIMRQTLSLHVVVVNRLQIRLEPELMGSWSAFTCCRVWSDLNEAKTPVAATDLE